MVQAWVGRSERDEGEGRAVARGSPDMGRDGIECRGVWFDGAWYGRREVAGLSVRCGAGMRIKGWAPCDVCESVCCGLSHFEIRITT